MGEGRWEDWRLKSTVPSVLLKEASMVTKHGVAKRQNARMKGVGGLRTSPVKGRRHVKETPVSTEMLKGYRDWKRKTVPEVSLDINPNSIIPPTNHN